jgi:hypothetical protein
MMALDPVLEGALRVSLGALFAGAALHKLRDPGAFVGVVTAYGRGVPGWNGPLVRLAASLVIVSEAAVVAAALISPPAYLGIAAAGLLTAYAAAMGANLARGNRSLDCGCAWGDERQPVTGALVLRNILLAAAAAVLTLPPSGRAPGVLDGASALAAAALLLLTYLLANQLIRNGQDLKAVSR